MTGQNVRFGVAWRRSIIDIWDLRVTVDVRQCKLEVAIDHSSTAETGGMTPTKVRYIEAMARL
jgi:hypothetical protein